MKVNNSLKRLGAILLAGSLAVFTASAADGTNKVTTTAKPAAKHQPATARFAHAIENSFEFFSHGHEPAGATPSALSPDLGAGLDQGLDVETRHAQANPIFGFRW